MCSWRALRDPRLILRRWRSTIAARVRALPQMVRVFVVWPACLAAVIAPIWLGLNLVFTNFPLSGHTHLIRFTFGDHSLVNPNPIRGMAAVFRRELGYDQRLIAGYFLSTSTNVLPNSSSSQRRGSGRSNMNGMRTSPRLSKQA